MKACSNCIVNYTLLFVIGFSLSLNASLNRRSIASVSDDFRPFLNGY